MKSGAGCACEVLKSLLLVLASLFLLANGSLTVQAADVQTGILRVDYTTIAPISRYDRFFDDLGFAGGTLGNEDNLTTGAFLGHQYSLKTQSTTPDGAVEAGRAMVQEGIRFLVVLARAEDLLKIVDAVGPDTLVFNAAAPDNDLRQTACRANLIHIAPSRAMLADAIAQYLVWKKWTRWFLIEGSNPDDQKLAEAYRRAAQKFGARIVEERVYEDTGGSRRADSGHVLVQRQMPIFTQNAAEHDVVIAADESDVFALYLPYHTWDARPVAGSAGLQPLTFHAAHEAWGATQFQRRFEKLSGRPIRAEDYNAWLAVRVIGEGVTRTGTADAKTVEAYILSDAFELAAFKGQKVTFRSWNGQLRQPILLTDNKITIAVSPQEGFLHHRSPLDSMGLDEPESGCTAFTK
ncbi:ABC transporter substrate-binding protein [Roseibium sediminis]|uniref:ABC transporter substrate-binding protein n=1 Tax=Roseibium sediminis TaxID=1775174 RepID=UPI00123D65E9|nr:ABC transporter substrate-binding protein [Roseibium sediminis]